MSQYHTPGSDNQGRTYLRQPPSDPRWSELTALLRDNQHPFRSTRSNEISQNLTKSRDVVQWYDDEISRLNAYVFSLQNRRADAQMHVRQYESLLAPIRKFPPEVLRNVFGYFCEKNVVGATFALPAVVLGGVCAYWRTLSVSFPELWANIELNTTADGFNERVARDLVQLFVQRNRLQQMSVTIHDNSDAAEEGSALSLLLATSFRWKHARLVSSSAGHAFAPLEDELHSMAHLELAIGSAGLPISMFDDIPSLRSVHIELKNPRFTFDGVSITSLTLRDFNFKNFARLFVRFSQLSTIIFSRCRMLSEVPFTTSSSLTDVSLLDIGSGDVENFLENATMPGISSMTLTSAIPNLRASSPFHIRAFSDFLSRSACAITRVTIHGHLQSANAVTAFMQLLPTVTEFEYSQEVRGAMEVVSITPALLRMTAKSSLPSAVLLPRLTKLHLMLKLLHDEDAFVEMVKSRWIPHATDQSGIRCLKAVSLKIFHAQKLYKEKFSPLRDISRAGMKVVLQDPLNGFITS